MITFIRIKKLAAADNCAFGTPTWEDYNANPEALASLPAGYEVAGFLLHPICVGSVILIHRKERNGTPIEGVFSSSTVKSFNGTKICTENSIYVVLEQREIAIEKADSTLVDQYPDLVARILAAIGHPEAGVSDETMLWHFFIEKPELPRISASLGITVEADDTFSDLIQKLRIL